MNQYPAEKDKLLMQKIADQEQEILFLHKQQRDIRFLARRLHSEIQTRLSRRANGFSKQARLTYQKDEVLARALSDEKIPKEDLLSFIHQRDKQSIGETKSVTSGYIKLYFWKFAAGIYSLISKVLKKLVRI